MINIGLADDHPSIRLGLKTIINKNDKMKVVLEASNGQELIDSIDDHLQPDIVILDISMPIMDGFKTAYHLTKNFPNIKILVHSVFRDENVITGMINFGASGFISKNEASETIVNAILEIHKTGHFRNKNICYSNRSINKLKIESPRKNYQQIGKYTFSDREIIFLNYCASSLAYKEIAGLMKVNDRTVHNYRESLAGKLKINTRVGLVLFAIKNGIVKLF